MNAKIVGFYTADRGSLRQSEGMILPMHSMQQRTFSPVIPPKVRPLRKPALSITALDALQKCQGRERELLRRDAWIFTAGLLLIAATLACLPVGLLWSARHLNPQPPAASAQFVQLFFAFEGGLLLITLIIALFTRKKSRADVADQVIDTGCRVHVQDDNPLVRYVLILVFLGLLYGEFLTIDAIKSFLVNFQLRNVDRHRAAVILAMLQQSPVGIDPRQLLLHGESPLHLREMMAYLIINEWADVSPHGDWLTSVSKAKRALRGYDVHGKEE